MSIFYAFCIIMILSLIFRGGKRKEELDLTEEQIYYKELQERESQTDDYLFM